MNRISSFTKFKRNYNTNNNIQKSRRYSTPCIQPRIDQDQISQSILNRTKELVCGKSIPTSRTNTEISRPLPKNKMKKKKKNKLYFRTK